MNLDYSKIGYLIIYETINTFHKHKKDLRETINNEQKELIEHFIILNDLLKAYKYSYDFDKTMSKIRNKTIAHFDKDYFEYYKYFEELSSEYSEKAIEDFLDFFKYLLYFTSGLNGGKIEPISRDILK